MAIDNVLKGNTNVNAAGLQILKNQQNVVDRDQDAARSFEHSMTGLLKGQDTNTQRPVFIQRTEVFIRSSLTAAINARRAGFSSLAFTNLGTAIHALQDATSPAHRGFQPWHDNEGWWNTSVHIFKESIYPDDRNDKMQVECRVELEGVVEYAFDIYIEKVPMPARFFDSDGNLQLPPAYRQR